MLHLYYVISDVFGSVDLVHLYIINVHVISITGVIIICGYFLNCCVDVQNELHFHDVIKLFRDDLQSEGPDGTQLVTLGMQYLVLVMATSVC